MTKWRAGGARERLGFGVVVVAVAIALLALTGSSLAAVLVIAAGLAVRPGDEAVTSRIVVPAVVITAYVVVASIA